MAKVFYGREYGTSMNMFGAGYIWGEDTKFKERERYCQRCDRTGKSFTVNFCGYAIREIEFCVECLEIVHKPRRLGQEAFVSMPVTIDSDGELLEGWAEKYTKSPPTLVLHCGQEMHQYGHREEKGVVTAVYECSICLRERLLKYFSSKETSS